MHRLLMPLGVLLLAGSIAAGILVFRDKWLAMGPPSVSTKESLDIVNCIGIVDTEDGVVDLYPEQTGEVVEIAETRTKDGKERLFKKGDWLLKLKSKMAQLQLDKARAAVEVAKAEVDKAKQLVTEHKVKREIQSVTIATAKELYGEADAKRKEAKIQFEKSTGGGALLSKATLEVMEKALDVAGTKVEIEKKKLELLDAIDPSLDVARAEAEVKARQEDVRIAEETLESHTLKAPADGIVLRVHARVGEVLGPTPRGMAIEFCPTGPDAPKIVRAEVVQEWEDRVDVSQEVTIEDDTYRGDTWIGRIKSLSPWIAPKRMRIVEPGQVNDVRTRECIIEIKEGQRPVRIGQRVRVKIHVK
jgi:multidrug resistance efflux pump